MKLGGLVPNFHIHVSASDLYIPSIGPGQTDHGIIQIAHRYVNVEIGRQNIIIMFWKYQGCEISFLGIHKSINRNQTLLLDSHRPIICSARWSNF
jgi:hypothetical protein